MRLDIDTEIRYPSGERAGFLRKVVVDDQNQVSVVVMETDDLISRRVIVPVDLLSEGGGDTTYVNATPEQIGDLPDYEADRVPTIGEGWEFPNEGTPMGEVFPATMYEPILPVAEVSNVPDEALSLTQGTEILCLDGAWGVVDQVITGADDAVTALIGRPYDVDEHKLLIPAGLVSQADANQVVLNCTAADLPTYTQPVVDEAESPEEE